MSWFDMGFAGNPVGTYTYNGPTTASPAPAPTPTAAPASPAPVASGPALPGLSQAQSNALSGPEQNAYQAVYATLATYGLQSLAGTLYNYAIQGYDQPTVNYLIQQTPEWQQRFAGNALLEKKGLAPLDPATYLATEQSYASVLRAAGIPPSMFGKEDFATWIGNSVAPTEIQNRAQIAEQWVNDNDPYFLQALQQFHGVGKGDLIGYALDQTRGLPFLNLVSQQAQIGAAALRHGLNANPDFASQLANMGVSQAQAETGYSNIAQELPRMQDLAKIAGKTYGQTTAEKAQFLGDQNAAAARLNIIQQEQAKFSGTPGLGSNFYHPAYGLSRDIEGAY